MKRLSQTESPIFVILCVPCFQRQSFLTFIECHKTFAQEMTVNEKLCNNIALKLQATYVLDIC